MIELKNDRLIFSFPQVHKEARAEIEFQRTLRIPDDGETYYLPPGLGKFPLRHVEDYASKVPSSWSKRGGVMLPMYQAEALWIYFNGKYPCAIKVATGKINAVSGEAWDNGLSRDPQDYIVIPEQPWLDGYCVEKGIIRQFVAMPLGSGYSTEEQLTGEAEFGGLQIEVFPINAEKWEAIKKQQREEFANIECCFCECESSAMGLAPGGQMRQVIYDDPFNPEDWELAHSSRCFVHICNSLVWQSNTGVQPPYPPPTAASYTEEGLPWFDYYSETPGVDGSSTLGGLKSVKEMGQEKGDNPLPENQSVKPGNVKTLSAKKPGQVSEWV